MKVGEEIEIVGFKPTTKKVVTGVEMFRKLLDSGEAGDNIGVLLRGVEKTDVERGQVLAKPGSITPHTKFKARVYVLSKEEGGRHTPFFNGYRPQFYIRTTDVTGSLHLGEGVEMIMPGDNTDISAELIAPTALEAKRSLRDSRGRPHGRRRHGHGNYRVGREGQVQGSGSSKRVSLSPEAREVTGSTDGFPPCETSSRWRAASASVATTARRRTRRRRRSGIELKKFCPLLPEAHAAQGAEVGGRARRVGGSRRYYAD